VRVPADVACDEVVGAYLLGDFDSKFEVKSKFRCFTIGNQLL
jgi:hypothetical protein